MSYVLYLVVLWIHVQCCVLLVWSHCLLCSLPCHEVSWMLYGGAQHCVLPVCEPVLSALTGKVDKAMRGTQLTPTIGRTSNATLRILSVRGVPPLFTDNIFGKKELRIWGVPPLYGFFPENFSSKRAKNCVFLLKKTPDFDPKKLRIWGVPPVYG